MPSVGRRPALRRHGRRRALHREPPDHVLQRGVRQQPRPVQHGHARGRRGTYCRAPATAAPQARNTRTSAPGPSTPSPPPLPTGTALQGERAPGRGVIGRITHPYPRWGAAARAARSGGRPETLSWMAASTPPTGSVGDALVRRRNQASTGHLHARLTRSGSTARESGRYSPEARGAKRPGRETITASVTPLSIRRPASRVPC